MNIHPLFVHFPIGLLVIYVLIELSYPFLKNRFLWLKNIKLFLVITGWFATIPAIVTGSIASGIIGETKLIETHETMALTTVSVFGIIAGAYIVDIVISNNWDNIIVNKYKWTVFIVNTLKRISKLILLPYIVIPLSLVALILITITGGLGASIVYGPEIDPVVKFIYGLFF